MDCFVNFVGTDDFSVAFFLFLEIRDFDEKRLEFRILEEINYVDFVLDQELGEEGVLRFLRVGEQIPDSIDGNHLQKFLLSISVLILLLLEGNVFDLGVGQALHEFLVDQFLGIRVFVEKSELEENLEIRRGDRVHVHEFDDVHAVLGVLLLVLSVDFYFEFVGLRLEDRVAHLLETLHFLLGVLVHTQEIVEGVLLIVDDQRVDHVHYEDVVAAHVFEPVLEHRVHGLDVPLLVAGGLEDLEDERVHFAEIVGLSTFDQNRAF